MTQLQRTLPILAAIAAVLPTASVLAQEEPNVPSEPVEARGGHGLSILVGGGGSYGFESDIDNGGELELATIGAGIAVGYDLTETIRLKTALDYIYSNYEFHDATSFGGDPWEEIHDVQLGIMFDYTATDDLSFFAGPVFAWSRESGADWTDSFIGGGRAGAAYRVNDEFIIGGGLVVVSQLDESERFMPFILLDWEIGSGLRLSTRGGTDPGIYGNTLELVYDAGDDWTFALGGSYRFKRFRLDDDGIAPDGVGQHEGVPIWLRATWQPAPRISLTGRVGVEFGSKLRLEDEGGRKINETDVDPIYMVGASLTVRF